MILPAYIFNGF